MKLERLELAPFGPFTETVLEFFSVTPGLHIIFGLNEAGKSSSLRGLRALLYGFPERTPDNFLTPSNQLRVGGVLVKEDGARLEFYRRKRRKSDLLDEQGNVLDPQSLKDYLGDINLETFQTLYGIDHASMVAGGKDILAQRGEIGQALFTAGTGISSLKHMIQELEEEAGALFKDRGTKQRINQQLRDYKSLKKALRDATLKPADWSQLRKQLSETEAHKKELEQLSLAKRAELQRLERLKRVIPGLGRLEHLEQQIVALGPVVVLPDDFGGHFQEVENRHQALILSLEQQRSRLTSLRSQLKNISTDRAPLDHREMIEDLHQRLGRYRKDVADRARLDGMRIAQRKEAGRMLEQLKSDMTLENIESLRPILMRKQSIRALRSRYDRLEEKKKQYRNQKAEAERELSLLNSARLQLPSGVDFSDLESAVKRAQSLGPLDEQIDQAVAAVDELTETCQRDLQRLGIWQGGYKALLIAGFPLLETVERFERQDNELQKERTARSDELSREQHDLQTLLQEQQLAGYGEQQFTERTLADARHKREQGWELLKRQWLEGEDIGSEAVQYDPDQQLETAYEKQVQNADEIADQLRQEADHQARAVNLAARIEAARSKIEKLKQAVDAIDESVRQYQQQWQILWQDLELEPLGPAEMKSWLMGIEHLRRKVEELGSKERELHQREKIRQQHQQKVIALLPDNQTGKDEQDEVLSTVLLKAESILKSAADQQKQRDALQQQESHYLKLQEQSSHGLALLEEDLTRWRDDWQKLLVELNLGYEIVPGDVDDLLDTISHCFETYDKAADLQSRINGIDRDVGKFKEDAETIFSLITPDLKDRDLEQGVLELHGKLNRALQEDERFQLISTQIQELSSEIERDEVERARLLELLETFTKEAKCQDVRDLHVAIKTSDEYKKLKQHRDEHYESLLELCETIEISEIKRQVSAVNVDQLPSMIENLTREIESTVEPEIEQTLKRIGEITRELKSMDGTGRAADIASELEVTGARIETMVEDYVRLQLAIRLLREEIERYRSENQDPILQSGSEFFSRLTGNSFSQLQIDIDDSGNTIIVGQRDNGSRVGVEGMSDGTADQLYLALRLATLESRLARFEPMPFIVDDILINFDDQRTETTLSALAALSEKNQVILFTHHQAVVETAQRLDSEGEVVIHQLRDAA